MKLLANCDGYFDYLEVPDKKIYQIHELKDCKLPPLCILYEHQLFINAGNNISITNPYWLYYSYYGDDIIRGDKRTSISSNTCYIYYYPLTGQINIVVGNTIERYRRGYSLNEGGSSPIK